MESKVSLPITKAARHWGYVTWRRSQSQRMKAFLKNNSTVHLFFMGSDHGEKNVDWKYCRISIGYKWTRRLPNNLCYYVLVFEEPNILRVTVE